MSNIENSSLTLSQIMNKLREYGYVTQFKYEDGVLYNTETQKGYTPQDLVIEETYRFEGPSDPGDNAILYAICSNDGIRGVLTEGYGMYGDSNFNNFIREIPTDHKHILR